MTLRRKVDEGRLTPQDEEYFWDNIGKTPLLCCLHVLEKEQLYRCDRMEKPLPKKEFEEFCLKCQAHVAQKLLMKEINGKKNCRRSYRR